MIVLYNLAMYLANALLWVGNAVRLSRLLPQESKFRRFIEGQRTAISNARTPLNAPQEVVWVHAASLGEYAVVRPIIQKIRTRGAYIVVTFFSSTGVDALNNGKGTAEVDQVLFLPLDTPRHARQFVSQIRPTKVLIAVSDLWPNYLRCLAARRIPTFLVAAKITKRSSVMQWYGTLFRHALRSLTAIMVSDEVSIDLLSKKNIRSNVVSIGDPLFDNALFIARQPFSDTVLEQFCQGQRVLIAGSIHDKKDINLIAALTKRYPSDRFVIVPHEVKSAFIDDIREAVGSTSRLYTDCTPGTDLSDTRILIVDTLGLLARIYRFGALAYVGGGFTKKLHSIIEPVVYGLPVAFGPRIHRKNTPQELINRGIGTTVVSGEDIVGWYSNLRNDEAKLSAIARHAAAYTQRNSGATDAIIQKIDSLCSV